jgi:precorrin-2 dehydrogenase/sirohydrochlorin ferrochelatase
MLPVIFHPANLVVGLAGAGEGLARRRDMLERAQIAPFSIAADAAMEAISTLSLLFVAGLEAEPSARLARLARQVGVPVNVEDRPGLCDFHVPAMVRRGDLLLTVSTGGQAPGLSRAVRARLEDQFGPEWDGHLGTLGTARHQWRQAGLTPQDISARISAFVAERGWLA